MLVVEFYFNAFELHLFDAFNVDAGEKVGYFKKKILFETYVQGYRWVPLPQISMTRFEVMYSIRDVTRNASLIQLCSSLNESIRILLADLATV